MFLSTEAENSRLTTIIQENTVLRSEIDVLRSKCKHLMEENRKLKLASVTIVRHLFLYSSFSPSFKIISTFGPAYASLLIIMLDQQFYLWRYLKIDCPVLIILNESALIFILWRYIK